eukprot:CAMPEP_0174945562 /NCGR_PEP_ID=MMETSP1355-20121228/81962_1 /TAXON_ID=464990 /ORGANISM="Hemiselmis tepida, Strain CCMP443" /LENGTH=57 /DNA_ID=CAMNT_0016192947 /DNA_START=241 /DNA_END=411 /DNA_ORIENTATION=+
MGDATTMMASSPHDSQNPHISPTSPFGSAKGIDIVAVFEFEEDSEQEPKASTSASPE